MNNHKIDDSLGKALFQTRWILYPMNFGLALAGAVYSLKFLVETYHLVCQSFTGDTEAVMVMILGLVDMLMVGNLIVMVYKGSHQIFIQRFKIEDVEDRPQWLDHVDSGILKVKVASSVAGITLIKLLKDFVNIEDANWDVLAHRAIIHIVCLISALIMAIIWRITHVRDEHHGQH